MRNYINNKYSMNMRFFISYEVGVMLGVADNSPTHTELLDSIERLCKTVKLNQYMVAEGFTDYCKEYGVNFVVDDMNNLFSEYGIEQVE